MATLAAALILAAAAAAHAAVAASQRLEGPVAAAATARAAIVADLEIAGIPRRLTIPGNRGAAERWAVRTTLLVMRTDGLQFTASAALLVMGGPEWADVLPGQQLRVSGTLRPAEAGQPHAGVLAASSAAVVTVRPDDWLSGLGHVRQDFSDAADRLEGDARGLLPGMVTGDTSGLDGELDLAMKTVGMTHLTAVSGANCSLILGALLLAARTVRLPRPAAAGVCLSGLGLFVLLVGPDPSVLRAAMMGGIGLAALAFGRAGRGLSLLCVAVIGLVLADPALAASFGFVLSVLATFGIVVAGRRIMNWLPSRMPRWAAAGVAVPLSAQLLCGPVIVLLQPQFAAYALPANVAAAAFVVPVTLLGTAALPLLPLIPAAADMLMMVSGGFAAVVAGTARFFAILPGAALPWPEGIFGLCTMALLSAVALAVLWLALHPAGTVRLALSAHARTSALLESSFAGAWRGGPVACAARSGASAIPRTRYSGLPTAPPAGREPRLGGPVPAWHA
ncbi:ComEC/Rec2 family competence protein [Arthrobacter sp. PAMC25284]|nr:ComEC/Rec2 family competence protein [Arthrobacter sp. PAMC25284]